jgi:acetyltransferase-like isoleucine patch superfamily enzyme
MIDERRTSQVFGEVISVIVGSVLLSTTVKVMLRILKKSYSSAVTRGLKDIGYGSFVEFPAVVTGAEYISLGKNFFARSRLRIEAISRYGSHSYTPRIAIGDNVRFESDCHVGCINQIVIGNNVLIASRVFIADHSHGDISADALTLPPSRRRVVSKGPIAIEDNVWIGEGAAVMANVTIGKNAIVGANAVVTRSVPSNAVVGGIPARIIRVLE